MVPPCLLERFVDALACHLSYRALSSFDPSRKDPFSSDQYKDGPPSEATDGRRAHRPRVDKDHKGRGYELSKGRYVEIDEYELEAVKLESTHTIEIDDFVPAEDIVERYLDKPHYIVPNGKAGADAFVVIRDAMKRKDKIALARVVLSNREHVIALKPLGKGLLGTTLRYPYELRDEDDYFDAIPSPRVSKDMVDLAAHILDTKKSKFDPHKFKDKYENALRALVKRKAAGKTIEVSRGKGDESNVIDPMDALKQSLGRKHAAKSAPKASRRARVHRGRKRSAA